MMLDFDIREYGAVGDGETLDTGAIQKAIDACGAAGGGRVVCGPGRFRTGSLELKSHVELHLAGGCTIVGSTDVADYVDFIAPGFDGSTVPECNTKSLLRAIEAEDIAVTGGGSFDGVGRAFYDTVDYSGAFYDKPPTPRPRMVMFYRCRDVRFEGASFIDSPCWTFWLMHCERITMRGLRIMGDQRMINNDGIDLDGCRDVTVSDCIIRTGDDCLVLRAIQSAFAEPRPCENIAVANCVLDTWCQGVRVGCPSDGVIRNATFSNLTIRSRNNGILFEFPHRYLIAPCTGAADVQDILFSNITINCAQTPIGVMVEEGVALTELRGFRFSDIRIRSGRPITIQGSPETTIRDVALTNVTVETTGDDAVLCRRCDGVKLNNVELTNRPKGRELDIVEGFF